MTAVSRFRLFGRPPTEGPPPYPAPPVAPPAHVPPPRGATVRPQPVAAAPSGWPPTPGRSPTDDPPTDPFGFAPVPPPAPRPAGRSTSPDPAEAASLAGAFAVDYLSWDEDDPARRGRVLRDYLPVPGNDPAHLGWSGRGRQRAEFALPGLARPDGEGRVLVDVRVRVTPYRAVGEHGPDPSGVEPEVAGIPAVAPAPTGRGWRSMASYWIRISVPVAVEGGRLVVDAWEETLGEEQPPPPAPTTEDHSLADDDPLAHPAAGGAW